jgi:hypothetical protein
MIPGSSLCLTSTGMGRAVGASELRWDLTQAVGLGWYVVAPLALVGCDASDYCGRFGRARVALVRESLASRRWGTRELVDA